MDHYTGFLEYVWAGTLLAEAFWLGRLCFGRLVPSYPVLTSFLVFLVLQSVSSYLLITRFHGHAYAYNYIITQILSLTFSACLLIEIYNQVAGRYTAFHRLGQYAMRFAFAVSAVALVGVLLFVPAEEIQSQRSFLLFEQRNVYLALTGLALFLGLFIVFFDLRPCRNVRTLFLICAAMFAGEALFWVLRVSLEPAWRNPITLGSGLLHIACMTAGGLLFSRAGERQPAQAPVIAGVDEGVLVGQMEALNQSLIKVLRP